MANLIISMFWKNIDPKIVSDQKRVFGFLGYEINQVEADGVDHGKFIDKTLASLTEDDSVLFVDIDCFPMNAQVIHDAFAAAQRGQIFGCAQTANHINAARIYAGPMFLCLSRKTWDKADRPSAVFSTTHDVGQLISDRAATNGTKIDLLFPTITILPKWKLAGSHVFGIGTFYEGKVFHLFESHVSPYNFILESVATSICQGKEVDYFSLMKKAQHISHFEKLFKIAKRFGL